VEIIGVKTYKIAQKKKKMEKFHENYLQTYISVI